MSRSTQNIGCKLTSCICNSLTKHFRPYINRIKSVHFDDRYLILKFGNKSVGHPVYVASDSVWLFALFLVFQMEFIVVPHPASTIVCITAKRTAAMMAPSQVSTGCMLLHGTPCKSRLTADSNSSIKP